MANRSGSHLATVVSDLAGPTLASLNLVVDRVTVTMAGSRRLLRVVVDRDDDAGGLSLDDVAQASRKISAVLDGQDAIPGAAYVLEVTSPGVDRLLDEPRHFRRNVGRMLTITLTDGTKTTGRLVGMHDESLGQPLSQIRLILKVPGAKKGTTTRQEIAWPDVVSGRVEVEFKAVDRQSGSDALPKMLGSSQTLDSSLTTDMDND